MRFKVEVKNVGETATWIEEFDKPGINTLDEAEAWARRTVAWFNSTHTWAEEPDRDVVKILPAESAASDEHDWHKTNLMPLTVPAGSRAGSLNDAMECLVCGVTGKRYGLIEVKIDSKFRAKRYQRCSTAKENQ